MGKKAGGRSVSALVETGRTLIPGTSFCGLSLTMKYTTGYILSNVRYKSGTNWNSRPLAGRKQVGVSNTWQQHDTIYVRQWSIYNTLVERYQQLGGTW
jgi:hypothetical protein